MTASRSPRVRGHRIFLRLFLSVFAGLLLVACEPASQSFLSRGIGASLPTTEADMTKTHRLQRLYFNYLCQEAGLAGAAYGGPAGTCHIGAVDAKTWTLIVQQGLNDIDRRCDSYLQWLDNRRRSNGPLINQITSIGAATTGIMGITGASTQALTIAALAFGLAVQSVENYNGLLLKIDSSTVNSVVLNSRHTFRKNLRGKQFSNKPEAEYVLRSYLRLCLPFAIETNINDYSTFGSAGIQPTVENTINRTPVVGSPVVRANTQVLRPNRGQGTSNSRTQERISRAIQSALCLPPDGVKGTRTTEAIRIYQNTIDTQVTGTLSTGEENALINEAGACNPSFKNYLERSEFQNNPSNQQALAQLREDLRELSAKFGANVEISDTATIDTLRPRIAELKKSIGNQTFRTGNEAYLNTQYTPDLQKLLLE
ncbi:hypothetical protein [Roseibium album]|uniref:hypothetical protein n=1 Tax=Roseibium album TaxID=311410 RepID=UPI0039197C9E